VVDLRDAAVKRMAEKGSADIEVLDGEREGTGQGLGRVCTSVKQYIR